MGADVVGAVDTVDAIGCCFSEMDSIAADCPPPTRPFIVFVGFKVKMSSSLGVAVAALAVIILCVEEVEGGLELDLTIEAQDCIVE